MKQWTLLIAATAFGALLAWAGNAQAQVSNDGRQWRAVLEVCVTSAEGTRSCGMISSRATYPSKETCEAETVYNLLVAQQQMVEEGATLQVLRGACVPEPGVYDANVS